MNRRDKDVLLVLSSREYLGQRDLAAVCDCSLGAINASVNNLLKEKYIDEGMSLTKKGWDLFRACIGLPILSAVHLLVRHL